MRRIIAVALLAAVTITLAGTAVSTPAETSTEFISAEKSLFELRATEAPKQPDPPRQPSKRSIRPVDRLLLLADSADSELLLGDWDGDGQDTLRLWFIEGQRQVIRDPDGTETRSTIVPGGVPLVGDWDGDGRDTVRTVAPAPDSDVIAGDFDGDGLDTVRSLPETGFATVAADLDGEGVDRVVSGVQSTELLNDRFVVIDGIGESTGFEVTGPVKSRVLAGRYSNASVVDDLRTLRAQLPGRVAHRSVEYVFDAVAPDGDDIEVWRVWGITVARNQVDNLEALMAAAYAQGIEFGGWGWRSHEQQIELRRSHCGESEFDIWERSAATCSPPTARPGSSRHEHGQAVDFTEDGTVLTRSSPGFAWLQKNAGRFGFINLPSEPWHWSDTGG